MPPSTTTPEQRYLSDILEGLFASLHVELNALRDEDREVNDAISDTLLAVLEQLSRGEISQPIDAEALLCCALRYAKAYLRSVAGHGYGLVALDRLAELPAPPEASPEEQAAQASHRKLVGKRKKALRQEIRRLPHGQRAAVRFRYVEGLTLAQAAKKLGRKPSTVHRNAKSGIDKLMRALLNAFPSSHEHHSR